MTMCGSQCPFNVGMRPQTQWHSYMRLSIITQCKCLNTSPRTIYRCQCPLSVDMTPQRQWYSYMRLSIITRCKRLNTSPRTICGCQCPFSVDMRPQRQRYSLHEIVNNHSVNVWTQAQGQCVEVSVHSVWAWDHKHSDIVHMRLSIITQCKCLNTSPRTICGSQCPFSVEIRPQTQWYRSYMRLSVITLCKHLNTSPKTMCGSLCISVDMRLQTQWYSCEVVNHLSVNVWTQTHWKSMEVSVQFSVDMSAQTEWYSVTYWAIDIFKKKKKAEQIWAQLVYLSWAQLGYSKTL